MFAVLILVVGHLLRDRKYQNTHEALRSQQAPFLPAFPVCYPDNPRTCTLVKITCAYPCIIIISFMVGDKLSVQSFSFRFESGCVFTMIEAPYRQDSSVNNTKELHEICNRFGAIEGQNQLTTLREMVALNRLIL